MLDQKKLSKSGVLSQFFVFMICALVTYITPSYASTPDGETPANEGVCDVLIGATPGLFGLCNAYCEAQDLDSFDKEPPRTKILGNYNKKKKAGDPDMPCLQVPCPCFTDAEIGAIAAGTAVACLNPSPTSVQIINSDAALNLADADIRVGGERCRFINVNTAPPTIRSFSITPEEAESCAAIISTACGL